MPKTLHITPSAEQQTILDLVTKGDNVAGDCVAGSGKTTSVLLLAENFPTKRLLQITYNKALKFEVRKKKAAMGLTNLDVHSYHSLFVQYYDENGHKDDVIEQGLKSGIRPYKAIPEYDILVIDEAQDMRHLFYSLVHKFLKDSSRPIPQMIVLGDRYQGVFKHQGSDSRFLTLCHKLWGREFTSTMLSVSYRVTNPMAQFVNEVMLGQTRIQATKPGPKIVYATCNVFAIQKEMANYINKMIKKGYAKPEDFFILAASVRKPTMPVKRLENELVELGIPLYCPTSDEAELDSKVLKGKLVFSTFNQSKGRERKFVIIYGFDDSYFSHFAPLEDPRICPETLYVAATRATHRLIILHHYRNAPLAFLKKNIFQMRSLSYIHFLFMKAISVPDRKLVTPEQHNTSPTDLVRHLKEHNIRVLGKICDTVFKTETEPLYSVEIPSSIECEEGIFESVSDINGVAIPAMFEAKQRNRCYIHTQVEHRYSRLKDSGKHNFLQKAYKSLSKELITTEEFVRLSILYVSIQEEIYHKIPQILRQDWLTDDMVEKCSIALKKHITSNSIYEYLIDYSCTTYPEYGNVIMTGFLDNMNDDTVFELKCTTDLSLEHKLQLLVYAWMWAKTHKENYGDRQFKLLNIRTGETLVLDPQSHLLEQAIVILFDNKYGKDNEKTDEEFLEMCKHLPQTKRCLIMDDDD